MHRIILMLILILTTGNARAEVGPDKFLHIGASAALADILQSSGMSPAKAFWITMTIGLVKEIADGRRADPGDMLANAIGAGFVIQLRPKRIW